MTVNRTYKEVVASLETHIIYISNHLSNIDQHLNKLNETVGKHSVDIAKNKVRISLIFKIGGGIVLLILGLLGIAAGLIRVF